MTAPHISPIIALVGPTASGKSQAAMQLARQLPGEIISCDSVQVYRGFDIGSAKPTAAEQAEISHHMIDVCEADAEYDAHLFAQQARAAATAIDQRGQAVILCGGTGLYLRTFLGESFHGLPQDPKVRAQLKKVTTAELWQELEQKDPERAAQLHPNDRVRIERAVEVVRLLGEPVALHQRQPSPPTPWQQRSRIVFLEPPRSLLHERIARRVDQMLEQGLVAEVEALRERFPPTAKPFQSIGYKQVLEFLAGNFPQAELAERIVFATRQYAKRQITWFKKTAFAAHVTTPEQAVTAARQWWA